MKTTGLILTVGLAVHEEIRDLYPSITTINLDELDALIHFNQHDVIALIIDIDSFTNLTLVELTQLKQKYKEKIILTSDSYNKLKGLMEYGVVIFKNTKLLSDQIMRLYRKRVEMLESDYMFEYATRRVIFGDVVITLRNKPFLILNHLVKNKNRPCSREELIKASGGQPKLADTRTIDVQINYIRKVTGDPRIKTVVNEGYIFEDKTSK